MSLRVYDLMAALAKVPAGNKVAVCRGHGTYLADLTEVDVSCISEEDGSVFLIGDGTRPDDDEEIEL